MLYLQHECLLSSVVEREPFKLVVAGSIPAVGYNFVFCCVFLLFFVSAAVRAARLSPCVLQPVAMKTSFILAVLVGLAVSASAFEYTTRADGSIHVPLARRRHSAKHHRVQAARRAAFVPPTHVAGQPPVILQKDFQDSEYFGWVSIGTPPQVRLGGVVGCVEECTRG